MLYVDGVGPVDNRPSTDYLHQFVQKNITCDTWHVTHDTWHVVIIVSKYQVPSYNGLGSMVYWKFGGKGLVGQRIN